MNSHDHLLLKDLNRQKTWIMIVYLITGLLSIGVGFAFESQYEKYLCAGGGFLIGLGIEKIVTQKIRKLALQLWNKHQSSAES